MTIGSNISYIKPKSIILYYCNIIYFQGSKYESLSEGIDDANWDISTSSQNSKRAWNSGFSSMIFLKILIEIKLPTISEVEWEKDQNLMS